MFSKPWSNFAAWIDYWQLLLSFVIDVVYQLPDISRHFIRADLH
jgi:hypothetical protein